MSSTRAAIRYAKAILDMATSKSAANEVSQDMTLIATTINGNAELNTFIQNPTVKVEIQCLSFTVLINYNRTRVTHPTAIGFLNDKRNLI